MTSAACVAVPITHLVSAEVIEGFVSTSRKWTTVAMMWIEAVIHVAVEVVGAMEPGSGSNKDTAGEPPRQSQVSVEDFGLCRTFDRHLCRVSRALKLFAS